MCCVLECVQSVKTNIYIYIYTYDYLHWFWMILKLVVITHSFPWCPFDPFWSWLMQSTFLYNFFSFSAHDDMLSLNVNSISKSSRVTGADLPFQSNEATTNQLSGLINNLYLQKSMVVKRNHYSWEFGPFVLESCWCLVSVWFVFMQILTPRGVTVLSKCEREMPSVCTSCNQGQHQISLRTAPYSDTPSFQHSAWQPGIRKSQQNPLVWSGVYMGLICFIWKLLNIEITDSCIQLSSPWLICVPGLWQTCKQWLTGDWKHKAGKHQEPRQLQEIQNLQESMILDVLVSICLSARSEQNWVPWSRIQITNYLDIFDTFCTICSVEIATSIQKLCSS